MLPAGPSGVDPDVDGEVYTGAVGDNESAEVSPELTEEEKVALEEAAAKAAEDAEAE